MPKMRRLPAVLAVAGLTVGLLAGCSSSSGGGADTANLPEAAPLLEQSAATTRAQQSVHLLLTTSGEGILAKLPIERLEGDLTNTPAVAAQGTADLNTPLTGPLKAIPFVVSGGNLYAALQPGGTPTLFGPAADIYDVSAILDPGTGLANVLASFTDPASAAREDVAGTSTVKITGKVSADTVNKIAPQLEATAAVPATAWVAADGDHQLVQAQLDVAEGSVTMTTTKWGEPVTVAPPA